ncbi:kinase-interacting protein 1 [Cajanus cajan]|uniref:kinase-interacting protein 1 n=1 Tax=Cajanus cajan TaxID=3821 RepID=UPI00098DC2F9|nr:kinase-interacting protein 1 [Cajanus cajan]
MLQRAASNAYSWWWASHIRTKQSKWMEQNLQDMEEKVHAVLKLLEEEGDSFAKRAEMYYKRRPELINFVEESFRAYRSLADRYDHISTELQNANNTIASVCPDQVPYMDEDDEEPSPRPKTPKKKSAEGAKVNIPKVPKPPLRDLKTVITTATKKLNPKKVAPAAAASKVPKSGLSRKEALKEIDRMQKEILGLQTVKEFVKSSYDNAIAKYWDTENQIKALQEKVSNLQDELGEGIAIDDEEARRLMAEAALKSCQDTLSQLEVKQAISLNETKIESKRVKEVREKLSSLMNEAKYDNTNLKEPRAKKDVKEIQGTKDLGEDMEEMTQQRQELLSLQEKIKEHFDAGSYSNLTVKDMAEKIDSLVNKVVSLETAVSSQTALVKRLNAETNELNSLVQALEGDKESLINDKAKLNDQLREMDEKLREVQNLNQIVENQNTNLQTHFTEAHCNLDHLSENVQKGKPDEEDEVRETSLNERISSRDAESEHCLNGQDALNQDSELLKDEKSNKEHKVTAVTEDVVNSDKVAEVVKDTVIPDNKPTVTGSLENEVKATNSLEMKEETPLENKSPIELKENSSNSDIRKSADALRTTADQASTKEESSVKQQENDSKQVSAETVTAQQQENDSKQVSAETVTAQQQENDSKQVSAETVTAQQQENDSKQVSAETVTAQQQENDSKQISAETVTDHKGDSQDQQKNDSTQLSPGTVTDLKGDSQEQRRTREDEYDWQELLNGMRDREQTLLAEYNNALQNYDEMKNKLAEIEKKNQDVLFESSLQLKELKTANALKDEEIRLLRQKLGFLQKSLEGKEGTEDLRDLTSVQPPPEPNDIEELLKIEEPESTTSAIEENFRMSIDELLEENLDFWLKFSTSFTGIQKFETTIKDLLSEVKRIEEKWKSSEGSSSAKYSLKSDARPLSKHLSEILNELTMWLENSALLKEELQCRFTSLCKIQEEITTALKASAEDDDFKFTSYQAAKFQGEVLNMKQENHRVADELQAGLDLVTTLQLDGEKALAKLNERFGLSSSTKSQRPSDSQNSVPLRSFIFGVKPKKQKQSIFSCMTPGMNRKYRGYRG